MVKQIKTLVEIKIVLLCESDLRYYTSVNVMFGSRDQDQESQQVLMSPSV